VLRAVFFAMSSLDRNLNLTIVIMLIGLMEGIHGAVRPFKKCSEKSPRAIYLISAFSDYF